jgi:micrococcal nuclease
MALALQTPTSAQKPDDLVGKPFEARVVAIIDGDTIDVLRTSPNRKVRIRLDGIDAPESAEPFAKDATHLARQILFDQVVSVVGKEVDRYGRLVARVHSNGRDFSLEMISAGLACYFLQYSSDLLLASAEQEAIALGRGFWKPGAPQPHCSWSKAAAQSMTVASVSGFVGNVQSGLYHEATCRNANCKNCTRHFSTSSAAEQAGFRPARDCIKH